MCNVKISMLSFSAAILAGGKATRMGGIPKGTLEIKSGSTMIECIAGEVGKCDIRETIVLANETQEYDRFGFAAVPDITPNVGPLGGIEAGLTYYQGRCDAVVFVPCDVPGIRDVELNALMTAFEESGKIVVYAQTSGSFRHPLCAVVHTSALPQVTDAIVRGVRKIGDVWLELGAAAVQFDCEKPFFNVNTPEDVVRWREGKS